MINEIAIYTLLRISVRDHTLYAREEVKTKLKVFDYATRAWWPVKLLDGGRSWSGNVMLSMMLKCWINSFVSKVVVDVKSRSNEDESWMRNEKVKSFQLVTHDHGVTRTMEV